MKELFEYLDDTLTTNTMKVETWQRYESIPLEESFYRVSIGYVGLYRTEATGRRLLLDIAGPGDYFNLGELSGLSAVVIGAHATTARWLVHYLGDLDAEKHAAFMRERLSFAWWRLSEQSSGLIRVRLGRTLEHLAKRFGAKRFGTQEGDWLHLPGCFSHQVFSEWEATSREIITTSINEHLQPAVCLLHHPRHTAVHLEELSLLNRGLARRRAA